jgi:sodium/bile acid cotransporter 3/5
MTYNQTLMMQDSNTSIVEIQYFSKDPKIADVNPESVSIDNPELEGQYFFNITANFLGYTEVCAKIVDANNDSTVVDCIKVSVIRKSGILDKVFTFSVVALVSIIYGMLRCNHTYLIYVIITKKTGNLWLTLDISDPTVNMGAALDTKVLKETLKRPVGPVIGFFSQFVIMPLVGLLGII